MTAKGKLRGTSNGRSPRPRQAKSASTETYHLVLYIAGHTANSRVAIANLQKLCETYISGHYTTEVVDVSKDPKRAVADQVIALPTLVRRLPPPLKRIIGTLANTEKVLLGLEIHGGPPA